MSSFSLQINSAGSNISTERVGSNVVVNIDNTATEEATTLATQAATRADEAAGRAEDALDPVNGELAKRVRTDTDDQGLDASEQTNARTNIAAAAAAELAAAQARIAELEAIEDLRNELYPISEILVLGSPVLAANNPIRTGA